MYKMELRQVKHHNDLVNNPKLNQAQIRFIKLINKLKNKNLPGNAVYF